MTHLDDETLARYWLGETSRPDEAAVEDHLFGCEACARSSERLAALSDGLRQVLPPIVSPRRLEKLARGGPLKVIRAVRGTTTDVVFDPEMRFQVITLPAPAGRGAQLDCELLTMTEQRLALFEDIPYDPDRGLAHLACQRHYGELGFPTDMRVRLTSVREGGREVIGEYDLHHVFL